MNTKKKTWIAYRIKGLKAEAHPGPIYAETNAEAVFQAYAIFDAKTPAEKVQVYVREKL